MKAIAKNTKGGFMAKETEVEKLITIKHMSRMVKNMQNMVWNYLKSRLLIFCRYIFIP